MFANVWYTEQKGDQRNWGKICSIRWFKNGRAENVFSYRTFTTIFFFCRQFFLLVMNSFKPLVIFFLFYFNFFSFFLSFCISSIFFNFFFFFYFVYTRNKGVTKCLMKNYHFFASAVVDQKENFIFKLSYALKTSYFKRLFIEKLCLHIIIYR